MLTMFPTKRISAKASVQHPFLAREVTETSDCLFDEEEQEAFNAVIRRKITALAVST